MNSFVTELNYAGKSGLKILAVTGSSGGHIFPAVAFLEAIQEKRPDIKAILVLPEKSIIKKNEKFNPNREIPGVQSGDERGFLQGGREPQLSGRGGSTYQVKYIKLSPISRRVDAQNIKSILNFISGSLESLGILLKFQPDVVVGFGSLASLPTIMFAWVFRIKILIHEQNVIPGRANRLLAGFVDKIAVSFQATTGYLEDYKRKIIVTGNPLRKSISRLDKIKALDFFGFSRDRFTILVMGGSQGSHRINEEFLRAVSCFKDKTLVQVIHLTGTFDYEYLNRGYKDLNIKFALFSFFDAMQYAYSISDLVISRAGATTIAELIFFRLPAILVPYPYAYMHQYKNAKVLEEKRCGIIIDDKEFNADKLRLDLEPLLYDCKKIEEMRHNYNAFPSVNASELLAKEVMALN